MNYLEYIALFTTTIEAIKYLRKLEDLKVDAEAIPMPRKLSSSCGIAISFSLKDDPSRIVDQSIRQLYRVEGDQYILLLQNEEG